ncbi:MAG: hypothetical protein A3K09_04995 [Nitrospinae bacterium RIFCSPLOWO2_12_FULL_47_7]|nr:MAG: hypothetical protein A3K09_04995 [Nitrospinae bacterium RIFCSPLOWO2_12_FULL_47_7]
MVFPMIKKDTVDVVIRTSSEKIEGIVYKLPETRLLDMLNKTSEPFLAVSNVRVYAIDTGKLLFETEFLVVNKRHIVHIIGGYSLPEV